MKKFLVLILLLGNMGVVQAFTDVSEGSTYYSAIESLANLGIVGGYEDGSFGPNNSVNRVEALKMILISAGVAVPEYDDAEVIGFSDVASGAWYMKFISEAKARGIVKGNDDGTFAPGRTVVKAEFLKMMFEAFDSDLSRHENLTDAVANDVQSGQWYAPYMSYAKTLGVITPTVEDNLLPGAELTRGECAEIIYRMLVIQRGGDAQKMLSISEADLVEVLVNLSNNNISKAMENAESAVFYAESGLAAAPDELVAQAAVQIAKGFRELTWAYQAGTENNGGAVQEKTTAAKSFAAEAVAIDSSFSSLQEKIEQIADSLLEQLN